LSVYVKLTINILLIVSSAGFQPCSGEYLGVGRQLIVCCLCLDSAHINRRSQSCSSAHWHCEAHCRRTSGILTSCMYCMWLFLSSMLV